MRERESEAISAEEEEQQLDAVNGWISVSTEKEEKKKNQMSEFILNFNFSICDKTKWLNNNEVVKLKMMRFRAFIWYIISLNQILNLLHLNI